MATVIENSLVQYNQQDICKMLDASSDEDSVVVKKKVVRNKFVDSDQEVDASDGQQQSDKSLAIAEASLEDAVEVSVNKKKSRRILIRDSSSDSDEPVGTEDAVGEILPKKFVEIKTQKLNGNETQLETENPPRFRLFAESDLYDAEGSEDETPSHFEQEHQEAVDLLSGQKKRKKKTPKSKQKQQQPPPPRMEMESEMEQIRRDSQRRVREARVSLPYHRPRQRTLAEFLQRRKSVPVTSLKASTEELGQVWKQIEEREKEAEIFYKSESESEKETPDPVSNEETHKLPGPVTASGTASACESDHAADATAVSSTVPSIEHVKRALFIKDMPLEVEKSQENKSETSSESVPTFQNHEELMLAAGSTKQPLTSLTGDSKTRAQQGKSALFLTDSEQTLASGFITEPQHQLQDTEDLVLHFTEGFGNSQDVTTKPVFSTDSLQTDSQSLVLHYDPSSQETANSVTNATVQPQDTENLYLHYSESENAMDATYIRANSDKGMVYPAVLKDKDTVNCPITGDENQAVTESAVGLSDITRRNTCSNSEEDSHVPESYSRCIVDEAKDQTTKNVFQQSNDTIDDAAVNCHVKLSTSNSEDEPKKGKMPLPSVVDDIKSDNSSVRLPFCGPPSSDSEDEPKKVTLPPPSAVKSKVSALLARKKLPNLSNIATLKPRLSGGPDIEVDLEVDVTPKQKGIFELMERFVKHSSLKKKPVTAKTTVDLSIISAEKGADGCVKGVSKDTVTVLIGADEDEPPDPLMAKPGAKLQRLRTELKQQMAAIRGQEWEQKLRERKIDLEEPDEDDLLDWEVDSKKQKNGEDEQDDSDDDEEEEEEEEEEDIKLVDKKRSRSVFVDDEAELSEEDAEQVSSDEDENEEEEVLEVEEENIIEKEENSQSTVDLIGDTGNEEFSQETVTQKTTPLQRTKTFDLFVSQADKESSGDAETVRTSTLHQPKTFDLFASQDVNTQDGPIEGPSLPAYQVRELQEPSAPAVGPHFNFLSPVLTPTEGRLMSQGSITPLSVRSTTTPINRSLLPNKKLFDDEPTTTQDNMAELMDLCSGKFSVTPTRDRNLSQLVGKAQPTTDSQMEAELLGLCSGRFTAPECGTTLPGDSQLLPAGPVGLSQPLEDDFQLLDLFQPLKTATDKTPQKPADSSRPKCKMVIASSSEDEEESANANQQVNKRIMQRKLTFSDDDNNDDDSDSEKNTLDSCDELNEDEQLLEYDSEENEIKVQRPSGRAVTDFFEAEAELTESEWGSADEDEKDLDELEWEEGDGEQLDQGKVNEQLGQIHLRQVMDQDRREVRLLQELLFEDGELHSEGGGRERKFRWKNIDKENDNAVGPQSGDEAVPDADDDYEDEAAWRRARFERETFLREMKEKGGETNIVEDEDSQLLKLGKAAMKRMHSFNSHSDTNDKQLTVKKTMSDPLMSPDPKHPFKFLSKRGSILARGKSALARLAQITSTADTAVLGQKNSRNFVFAVLSPKKDEVQKPVKRKPPNETPSVVKKLKTCDKKATKKLCVFDLLNL